MDTLSVNFHFCRKLSRTNVHLAPDFAAYSGPNYCLRRPRTLLSNIVMAFKCLDLNLGLLVISRQLGVHWVCPSPWDNIWP